MFKEFLLCFFVMCVCFAFGLVLAKFEIIHINVVIFGLLGLGFWAFISDIYPFIESRQRKRK